jgi:Mrp family chromosome partitioning ATPase
MKDPYPKIRRKPRLEKQERTRLLEEIAQLSENESPPAAPETLPAAPPRIEKLPRIVDPWNTLQMLDVNQPALERNLVITASRHDPAHAAFEVLRARLVQTLANQGWKRVAITSPTPGCGKTFVAVNLGIALSRYDNCRTVLLDMDMRHPTMASVLGVHAPGSVSDFLRGAVPPENHLHKLGQNMLNIGSNLALGLNSRAEDFAAEIIENAATGETLGRLEREISPDVMLFDLPPALSHDDVLALRPHLDAVLLVVSGDRTTARDIRETTRRLGERCPLLGIILNRSEDGAHIQQWV